MTRAVVWEEGAIGRAAAFLDDSVGLQAVFEAVGRLTVDPRPSGTFPYGSPDRRRLRVGRYRVMYDVGEETITVWHVARLTED